MRCRDRTFFAPIGFTFPLSLGLILASAASADRYVVDPVSGDDVTGSGSIAAPWRSVEHALDQLAAGDTLDLRGGVYDATNQGSDAAMYGWSAPAPDVVIRAHPGEEPIVDYSGLDVPASVRAITFGEAAPGCTLEGITFEGWTDDVPPLGEHLSVVGADSLTIRDCRWIASGGDHHTIRVRQVEDGSRDLRIEGCAFEGNEGPWSPSILLDGSGEQDRFIVRDCVFNEEADLALADGGRPAIAVSDADSVLIESCFGYNPGYVAPGSSNGSDFIVIVRSTRARVTGSEMIRYIGDWTHTGEDHPLHNSDGVVIAQGCEDVWVDDCAFWGAGHGIQVVVDCENVHLSRVYTDSTYDDGLFFDATIEASSATRNVIHHAWDNGIDVKGSSILVQHNTVVRAHSNAISIWGPCEEVTVLDNLVSDLLLPPADRGLALEGHHGNPADDVVWNHDLYWSPDPAERRFRLCEHPGCAELSFTEWQTVQDHDVEGLLADPLLVNPDGRAWPRGSRDFALLPGSPARQAASDGSDIGAIQNEVLDVATAPTASPLTVRAASPFHVSTTIRWIPVGTPRGAAVLRVTDVRGRRVRLLEAPESAGAITWDGRSDRGRELPSGVYFYDLSMGTERARGRIVRVR